MQAAILIPLRLMNANINLREGILQNIPRRDYEINTSFIHSIC